MKKLLGILSTALVAVVLCLSLFACTKSVALKVINLPLTTEDYAFAVQKGNTAVMTNANALIAEMKATGEFDKLINKYMGEDESGFIAYQNPTSTPNLSTQLVVATNAEFPPFESMLGNKFTGVDVEVAKALATKMGKDLYIANMDFDAVIFSVSGASPEGEIEVPTLAHIGMAGLTITDERKKSVDFTESYFTSSQMVIVREGDTTFDACTTADEVNAILNGFDSKTKIGYQNGTTGEFFTSDLKVSGQGYKNGVLAAQDLQVGRLNYVIIDLKPATSIAERLNALLAK